MWTNASVPSFLGVTGRVSDAEEATLGFGWSNSYTSAGGPVDLNTDSEILGDARNLGLQIRAIANQHPDVLIVATAGNDSAGTAPSGTGTPWAKDVHAMLGSPFNYASLGPQTALGKLVPRAV